MYLCHPFILSQQYYSMPSLLPGCDLCCFGQRSQTYDKVFGEYHSQMRAGQSPAPTSANDTCRLWFKDDCWTIVGTRL